MSEVIWKTFFGYAEHRLKGTFGLGFFVTNFWGNDKIVVDFPNESVLTVGAIAEQIIAVIEDLGRRINKNDFIWFVLQYTPILLHVTILSKQILSRAAPEWTNTERSQIEI